VQPNARYRRLRDTAAIGDCCQSTSIGMPRKTGPALGPTVCANPRRHYGRQPVVTTRCIPHQHWMRRPLAQVTAPAKSRDGLPGASSPDRSMVQTLPDDRAPPGPRVSHRKPSTVPEPRHSTHPARIGFSCASSQLLHVPAINGRYCGNRRPGCARQFRTQSALELLSLAPVTGPIAPLRIRPVGSEVV
jgi:hypothetical protein